MCHTSSLCFFFPLRINKTKSVVLDCLLIYMKDFGFSWEILFIYLFFLKWNWASCIPNEYLYHPITTTQKNPKNFFFATSHATCNQQGSTQTKLSHASAQRPREENKSTSGLIIQDRTRGRGFLKLRHEGWIWTNADADRN